MNAQQVWQSQPTDDAPRISLDYVRHQARSLESRTRLRNALEYGTGVLCFFLFSFSAWQEGLEHPIMVASLAWFAVWSLYYMYRWHGSAAVKPAPGEDGVLDTLRYQRQQLGRQRDFRRDIWRWSTPTVLPAFVLFLASKIIEENPVPWNEIFFLVLWVVLGIAIAVGFLEAEVRRFQREIDALDSLVEPAERG
jgi:hypothetical protein